MSWCESFKSATEKGNKSTEDTKLPMQVKHLLRQLSSEINMQVEIGDWDSAVKLAYYRHEFGKSHNFHDWYDGFLEIKKIKDKLDGLRDVREV